MKLLTKKALSVAIVATLSAGLVAGCGTSNNKQGQAPGGTTTPNTTQSGQVSASGSTALLPLVKQAAKDFMDKNPNVTVNPSGGGSGTGLKQVAEGSVNIGNSDVAADDPSKDNLVDHVVAIAPFALIVNKDVNLDNLSKQQATDILMGKITNWKDVGGNDLKITIVQRPESSGSRKLVKQIVLDNKEFTKEGITQESSGSLKTAVSSTSGAIGYIDTPYVDDTVKALKFDSVAFSKDAIKNGSYKLYGIEHMYTKGEPTGAVKAFLDYIMSEEFQTQRVEQLKFLPATTVKK